MLQSKNTKSAKEIIDDFFNNLDSIDGIDQDTASVIKSLWNDNKLIKEELMKALEKQRNIWGENDNQKT